MRRVAHRGDAIRLARSMAKAAGATDDYQLQLLEFPLLRALRKEFPDNTPKQRERLVMFGLYGSTNGEL